MRNSIVLHLYIERKDSSNVPFKDNKIVDQNTEQIENRLCSFNTISLSFIMVDHRKESYKRTGFTINLC